MPACVKNAHVEVTAVVGENGVIHEVVDMYLVEVHVDSSVIFEAFPV